MINNTIKKLGKDTLMYLPGNLFLAVGGFLSLILYTKLFNPVDYGRYILVYSAMGLLIAMLNGWITQSALRFSGNQIVENKKVIFSTIFITISVINIGVITTAVIFINMFGDEITDQTKILIYSSLFLFSVQSYYSTTQSLLRVMRKAAVFSINNIIISICKILVVYVLVIFYSVGVESIIFSFSLGYTVAFLFSLYAIDFKSNFNIKLLELQIVREYFKYGFPLIGLVFLEWVLAISDRYLIQMFEGSSNLGVYSINYSISSSMILLINSLLMMGSYPLIVSTWNKYGKGNTESVINKILKYYLLITLPIIVILFSFSEAIMQLISTKDYVKGHLILPIVSIGLVFLGMTQYTNKAWELTKKPNAILKINFLVVLLNIILNLLFIPYFGYMAAAVTTAISYCVYFLVSYYKTKDILEIYVFSPFLIKIIISSILMYLITILVSIWIDTLILEFIVGVAMGIVVYIISILIFGVIKNEVKYIHIILKNKLKSAN